MRKLCFTSYIASPPHVRLDPYLQKYFKHQPRGEKDAYAIVCANRMTDIYDPLMAIDIFAEVLKRHPKTKLKMNAAGELRSQVEAADIRLRIVRARMFRLDALTGFEALILMIGVSLSVRRAEHLR